MPQELAVVLCGMFVLWLFYRDHTLRPMSSGALWIVLVWVAIVGSRPVSFWFGGGFFVEKPTDYLDGSPLDRNVFLVLFLAACIVLWQRRQECRRLLVSNPWCWAFFLYGGLSLLWSDFPFVGFKRWIKDLGQVAMVLIMATEADPVQATKAVLARYTYLAMPVSLLLIKYVPDLGRYYNQWTWEVAFCGVAADKNELGCIVFVCALFLGWEWLDRRTTASKTDTADVLGRLVLSSVALWVVVQAGSSTAKVCLGLGLGILLAMQLPGVQRQARYLGTYALALGVCILAFATASDILEAFVGLVGRDTTLTGRTELWSDLLNAPIDPLLGTGYQSFWLGPYAGQMWEKYYFRPIQAHNGYLETYLHGGLIGLCLLIAMLAATGRRLKQALIAGESYGTLCFVFLTVAIFYNWAEALFNKMSLGWIIVLLAVLSAARQAKASPENGTLPAQYEVVPGLWRFLPPYAR